MSKKKGKFDLTKLVQDGSVKDGQTLFFVSDASKTAQIQKQPNHEYKLLTAEGVMTVHAFAQKCLGVEPPDHATRWFRTEAGTTIYELWQSESEWGEAA